MGRKFRPHNHICRRCDAGMDDEMDAFIRNNGLCDECVYEQYTGKMRIDAPAEVFRSSYNFVLTNISTNAAHVTGKRR